MIFKAWKKLEQQSIVIKSLWAVIAVLVAVIGILSMSLATVPNRLTVYMPPDISQGATLKPGHVHKSNVYGFAFQIFTAINSWPNGGNNDYRKNISQYKNYLSTSFLQHLKQDENRRDKNDELSRKRMMSGVASMPYKPSYVTKLGNGTWLVDLHLQVIETFKSSVIKNVIIDYPMIVSKANVSIQVNPWQLKLDGFKEEPHRIKTIT